LIKPPATECWSRPAALRRGGRVAHPTLLQVAYVLGPRWLELLVTTGVKGGDALLAELRFLEATGPCEPLARRFDSVAGSDTFGWWSGMTSTARAYRVATADVAATATAVYANGLRAILVRRMRRVLSKAGTVKPGIQNWLEVIPGGAACVAWLSGYVAAAELDGHAYRISSTLCRDCRDCVDVSTIGVAPPVYEQLQLTADLLRHFLPPPQHRLSDMRRFPLVPETFPS